MITVDGGVGFVTGLCVGQSWVGYPERGIEPWRDTGVMIVGPAVADIERAFAQMWALLGPPIAATERPSENASTVFRGETALRVVASQPTMAGLYRLDLLIAAIARNSIWLTDAYFLGTPSYVQSLCAAALDGVDVRLLLPRTSDVPVVRTLSRVGYRTLLEGGVRIFEWNGTMLHAKTAVADRRWARVGSTNLNLSSWMGNYELDIVAEDEGFATQMEEMYVEDLAHSTEIILNPKRKARCDRSDYHREHGRRRHHAPPPARAGRSARHADGRTCPCLGDLAGHSFANCGRHLHRCGERLGCISIDLQGLPIAFRWQRINMQVRMAPSRFEAACQRQGPWHESRAAWAHLKIVGFRVLIGTNESFR
jgi:cardiolipin synthase